MSYPLPIDRSNGLREALDNVMPADAYFGRKHEVVSEREKIKKRTMRKRKKEHLAAMVA